MHSGLPSYVHVYPHPADVWVALADLVDAGVGRQSLRARLDQVRAVLARSLAALQRDWNEKKNFM